KRLQEPEEAVVVLLLRADLLFLLRLVLVLIGGGQRLAAAVGPGRGTAAIGAVGLVVVAVGVFHLRLGHRRRLVLRLGLLVAALVLLGVGHLGHRLAGLRRLGVLAVGHGRRARVVDPARAALDLGQAVAQLLGQGPQQFQDRLVVDPGHRIDGDRNVLVLVD